MNWFSSQSGWRALFLRMALLTALWLMVGFVFTMEFYLAGLGGAVKLPWSWAARSAVRDWLPWMLLSPAVVFLAGRFRFERFAWKRSLTVHMIACLLSSLAYEALVMLTAPLVARIGGNLIVTSTPFSVGDVGSAVAVSSMNGDSANPGFRTELRPLPWTPGTGVSIRAVPTITASPMLLGGVVTNSLGVFSISNVLPTFTLGTAAPGAFEVVMPSAYNRWTSLLHMAATRTQFTIPVYWCVVCICWIVNHFQEARERERRAFELESRLTQANLRALKMQLQPHFLFNTLNAISSLIPEDPKAADDMVVSLSQFLRTTLDVSAQNEISLGEELAFVDCYLDIQQARFTDRLRIRREVDPDTYDALIPPLILQPLIENAIRHGIEARETGGTVAVRAFRHGPSLQVEIVDDGEGFRGGQLLKAGTGIGLSNTKARLQELYGDQHHFSLTANQPSGACVRIEIPFRLAPVAAAE